MSRATSHLMIEAAGVLPVDKPEGPTSHDVVAAARRALGMRRIGHTGTLDPFASGLLLLCTGRATRLAQYLGSLSKTYLARMRLGLVTDTDDSTGTVLDRNESWTGITESDLRAVFENLVGDIDQVPPAYSAKKVAGERAYRLARSGKAPELAPARVHVEAIRPIRFDGPIVDFEVRCGSGTYIRALARDAGRALGTGAHLTRLRRTGIDGFAVQNAVSMDGLTDSAAVAAAWIEPLHALRHLPCITLTADQVAIVTHGGTIPASPAGPESGPVALAADGRLLAIGEPHRGRIQPRTVLA